jgi:exodeoxyribonuclease-3
MKIIAWNVNGIRSLLKTSYLEELLCQEKPDILCVGETKLNCNYTIDDNLLNKFKYKFFGNCKKAGYSGTAIFSNKKPINVKLGLEDIDDEGRMITLEFRSYYLIHVYTPNSGVALARLDWRTKVWDKAFYNYINHLQHHKPVIICGDLNVAHYEIDIKNPKSNLKTAGYTIEERTTFNNLLNDLNLVDTFRYKYPDKIKYSYWSYRNKSREKNIGWRIDYFLLSNKIKNKVIESDILTDIYGSDHSPIKLILK